MGLYGFLRRHRRWLSAIFALMLFFVSTGLGNFVTKASASGTWVSQTVGAADLGRVAYGNGLWIMTDSVGDYYTSTDAVSWSIHTGPCVAYPALYTGSQWLMGCAGGDVYTSSNGTSWTKQTTDISYDIYGLATNGTEIVGVGMYGWVIYSGDGISWTKQQLMNDGTSFNFVTYDGGQFVAVGDAGKIYTSADGVAWTAHSYATSNGLYAVTYGKGTYVAAGGGGMVLSSTDGFTWTPRTIADPSYNLSGAAYGAGKFVVDGDNETIITSPDGITWTSERSNVSSNYLLGATYGAGKFVVVGGGTAGGEVLYQQLSTNADLSGLSLSVGSLTPTFAAGTTSYTASVSNSTTSVNVTPTLADNTASMKVNGATVTNGSAKSVPLNVGSNTITVLVTAQDGTTQKSYTVTVTRAAALSSNADLSSLTLSAGTLNPAFASGTTSYTASVSNNVTGVNVTPTVADGTASVTVNGNAATSGSPTTVPLNVGQNTITVLVTAQDGTTQKSYTVTVTRAAALSSNADLSSLTLSAGTLTPVFDSATLDYTASVTNDVTSVDVTPTVADSTATVKVNGNAVTSGNAAHIALNVGSNTITIQVTAEDGTPKTYSITVTRAQSSNADLSSLTLSAGTLTPVFDSATLDYTTSVTNDLTSVDITPTVADNTATVKVNGNAVTSGNAAHIALNVGSNTITVLVTAEDGTPKTYSITVTRAQSSNADLSSLTLSAGTLTPAFDSATLDYTTSVTNDVTSVDVTPTVADNTATVTVNGNAVTSGYAAHIALNVGSNTITIQVTAQDGTPKTYSITVTREQSSNADLSYLNLSQGLLTPTFASGITSYNASVENSVTSEKVTATVADSNSTLKINGKAVTSGNQFTVWLKEGANTITILVTAQDGTQKTYTVMVIRKGNVTPPPAPTGGLSGTVHSGNPNGSGNSGGNDNITQLIGSQVTMSGQIYDANGQLVTGDVKVDANGNFTISSIQPGTYQMVLYVNGPNGEQLAGQKATLTVTNSGQVSVQSQLIDPYGTVRDSVTNQPIDGVKVSLYWADTDLNRSQGRTPGTLVQLPELVGMTPNQNQNAQTTTDGGKYGWMVFPKGDYYIVAEKDGYETYDSRNDQRDDQQGDTSYIRNGNIHVGETIVQMNFNLQPKVTGEGTHQPYIFGYTDGTFQPDQAITRAQLAAILSRLLPESGNAQTNAPFADVPSSDWAAKAIAEIYSQHLMTGYPDGKFHPNDLVTRAQMAVILTKWKQLPQGQTNMFSDIDGHWAKDAILQAESAGFVSGFPDGTFRPNDSLTRAQAVVILNKVLGWDTHNVVGSPKWSDVPSGYWAYNDIMEASVEHQYQLLGDGLEIWQ